MNTKQHAPHLLKCSTTSQLHVFTESVQYTKKQQLNTPFSPFSPVTPNNSNHASNLSLASSNISCDDHDRKDSVDLHTLLLQLKQVRLDTAFAENGYKKLHKICDTLQGKLYKAQHVLSGRYVVIKKTDKMLFKQKIAIQDDDTKFCITENVVKEGQILKYLTVDNSSIGNHIVRYMDSFVDHTSYYLVTDYIESETNLKQFVHIAHEYITKRKMRHKHYQQVIKYLFWQLSVTIRWMHDDMNCCHLDLFMENIMLQNCSFKQDKDGYMTINPSISIKLCDFGVAEIFPEVKGFICNKHDLSLENASYLAPNVYAEETYDARCADMWSLGMIIFQCLSGESLYEPIDIWMKDCNDTRLNGYYALHNGNLRRHLLKQRALKCFTTDSLDLLLNLLQINETKRINAVNVLQHNWFKMYFEKYHKQIIRKSMTQQKRLLQQKKTMKIDHYQY